MIIIIAANQGNGDKKQFKSNKNVLKKAFWKAKYTQE